MFSVHGVMFYQQLPSHHDLGKLVCIPQDLHGSAAALVEVVLNPGNRLKQLPLSGACHSHITEGKEMVESQNAFKCPSSRNDICHFYSLYIGQSM